MGRSPILGLSFYPTRLEDGCQVEIQTYTCGPRSLPIESARTRSFLARQLCMHICAYNVWVQSLVDKCELKAVNPEQVAAARRVLISPEEASSIAEIFKLVGEPGRARLLYALLEAGELCVCDLAATVEAPQPAVSQGLRLLRSAGIVKLRKAGRMSYYSLADSHVRMLLDLSREHLRHGTGNLP